MESHADVTALTIITPLIHHEWEKSLASHPDSQFVRYLLSGINHGFGVDIMLTETMPSNVNSVLYMVIALIMISAHSNTPPLVKLSTASYVQEQEPY